MALYSCKLCSVKRSFSISDWWSSWISTAREKSVSALNATKRDLAEFVSVLGSDTKAAVKGASNNINKIVVQSPSTSTEEEKDSSKKAVVPVLKVEETAPYDRCQAELFSVQNNTDTYLQDPPHGKFSYMCQTVR